MSGVWVSVGRLPLNFIIWLWRERKDKRHTARFKQHIEQTTMAPTIFVYHHFLASNLAACKLLTATKPTETQKDQSQV